MNLYDEVVTLADQLPLVEKARLLEHLSGVLKRDLDVEAFRRMPWEQFIEQTSGSLAESPIERPPQLPLEQREPVWEGI